MRSGPSRGVAVPAVVEGMKLVLFPEIIVVTLVGLVKLAGSEVVPAGVELFTNEILRDVVEEFRSTEVVTPPEGAVDVLVGFVEFVGTEVALDTAVMVSERGATEAAEEVVLVAVVSVLEDVGTVVVLVTESVVPVPREVASVVVVFPKEACRLFLTKIGALELRTSFLPIGTLSAGNSGSEKCK